MGYEAELLGIFYSQWDYQMVKTSRILKFLTWHGFDEFGWNDPQYESVCRRSSNNSTICYLCKKEFSKLSNLLKHLQIHSNQKCKPMKISNLEIKEKTKMFPSMATFDQDLDRLDAGHILWITENELPTNPLMSQIHLNYFHICQNLVELSPNIRDVNPS